MTIVIDEPDEWESAIASIKIWWREADEDELADKLERSQTHVQRYIKVWRVYGLDGDDEGMSFNECYQKCKSKGSPKDRGTDSQDHELDTEEEFGSEPESNYLGNSDLPDLLTAIAEGTVPAVLADKVAEDALLASREDAEEIYDWVCAYVDAIEGRSDGLTNTP